MANINVFKTVTMDNVHLALNYSLLLAFVAAKPQKTCVAQLNTRAKKSAEKCWNVVNTNASRYVIKVNVDLVQMTLSESNTVHLVIKRSNLFLAVKERPALSLYPHAIIYANDFYPVVNINVSKLVMKGIVLNAKRK